MKRIALTGFALALAAANAPADTPADIVAMQQGSADLSAPVFDWWHGCSATSAGMLMAYYDIHGYNGKYYDLIPGGVAETTMIGSADEGLGSTTAHPTMLVTTATASGDHIDDFWVSYGSSGNDPLASGRTRPDDFDCIADFMGTNQDTADNSDGGTSFYNFPSGSSLSASAIYGYGPDYYNKSGMYGIFEWLQYRGYEDPGATGTTRIYNQYRLGYEGAPSGFTFDEYKAEIDAGRVVLIHVEGHTMLGDGYNDDGGAQTVLLNNTWTSTNSGEGTMTWGGSYSGMLHTGVTVVELDEKYGEAATEGGTATFEYIYDPSTVPGAGSSTDGMPEGSIPVGDLLDVDDFSPDGGPGGWMTLKFFYDAEQLAAAGITSEEQLRMYYWDDVNSEWVGGGSGDFYDGTPMGGLGDFGVDADGNYAWVNVDHASYWTVLQVPEPGTALLALLGAAALLRRRNG